MTDPDAPRITLDRHYVNGAWTAPLGTATMQMFNPATEAAYGTLALGDARDVDRAVAAATAAFESRGRAPLADRLALLERIHAGMQARAGDLARAQSREMGAPITAAREAMTASAIGQVPAFAEALAALPEREVLANGDTLLREPIGVVGLITPWNWPLYQAILKVIPALATGCCAILKPSEHSPLSAQILAEILHEAGTPPGAFALIQGTGPEVGAAMSRHPGIQMMSFTGSTRGGRAVTTDSADTVKRVTLELGGKSPNLVFASARLEVDVARGVDEITHTAGQLCDAPTRMLVERSVYDRAVAIAAARAEATPLGDPSREGDHIGPVVNPAQWARVQGYIEAGLEEGARLAAGGPGKPQGLETGLYVRPTVFADVTPGMTIWREEIFGPVLCMMPFDTEDEAVALANDTPYGLAAYVQTQDTAQAGRVSARLRAGAVHVNGGVIGYGTPYGGMKASGNGREGGAHGLSEYQEIKTLHFG